MRTAFILLCLLYPSISLGEASNYLLGSPEQAEAPATDAQLSEINLQGITLGMSEEEVETVILKHRNKDGGIHYRLGKIEKDCQDRSDARWCVFRDFSFAGFTLPLITRFSSSRLVGVFFEAPQGGRLRSSFKNRLATYARDVAEQNPPTQSDADSMTWQGENIVVSIDWEEGKMMYIDTSAAPQTAE